MQLIQKDDCLDNLRRSDIHYFWLTKKKKKIHNIFCNKNCITVPKKPLLSECVTVTVTIDEYTEQYLVEHIINV